MRSLKENIQGVIDISTVIVIGVAFAALMVLAIVIWKLNDQLIPTIDPTVPNQSDKFALYNTSVNITEGFDDAINLILVAVTVFILAIAIAALLMLRGRKG